jgi:uncharacterized protein involved in exopolysaccharide biosynthesis
LKFNENIAQARADLLNHLAVTAIPETRLIRVGFSAENPKEAKTIIEEIVEQHIKDQQDIILAQTQERSIELTQIQNRLRAKISTNEAMLAQYRVQLGDGGSGVGRLNVKEIAIEQSILAQTGLEIKYRDLQAELDQLQQELARGTNPPSVDEIAARDPKVNVLRQQALRVEFHVAQLQEEAAEDDKRVLSARKYYEKVKAQLDDAEGEARVRARNLALDRLKLQASKAKSNLEMMTARVDELKTGLGELSNVVAKYYTLLEENKGLRERSKEASDQLDSLVILMNHARNRVAWRVHPQMPMSRD